MARAKRTDRAEARRQYRAYLAAQAEARAGAAVADADEPAEDRGASARPARARAVESGPRPGERLGMFAAARAAFRTPTYLDDLRNIGPLVFRTNAIWPVAALCLIAAVISYPRINPQTNVSTDPILSIVFQLILYPTALVPPMIAGFLSPRSTWLSGMLAGLISTTAFIVLVTVTPTKVAASGTGATTSPSPSATTETVSPSMAQTSPGLGSTATVQASASPTPTESPAPAAIVLQSVDVGQVAFSGYPLAITFGAVIGAASGWYKRFLDLTAGGRQRGSSKPSGQKRPVRRGRTARR